MSAGLAMCEAGYGAIAQLGERLLCKQEVVGSIPSGSTIFLVPAVWFSTDLGIQLACKH
jgi:hypothetical protein